MVKIDDTNTNMLVDSGAQSTVLGERQFNNLSFHGFPSMTLNSCLKLAHDW